MSETVSELIGAVDVEVLWQNCCKYCKYKTPSGCTFVHPNVEDGECYDFEAEEEYDG